ncbi:MAG: hypothetical protein LBR89_01525 [Holosporales bacterium]|jgi:membrane-bound ClpP family serine protease|nr:hypothetical protein [Holosporales bacterium]
MDFPQYITKIGQYLLDSMMLLTGQRSYAIIAFAATALFVLKLLLEGMGDADVDVDVDVDGVDHSFTFVSLQSILSFLMGFGWIGVVGMSSNIHSAYVLIFSILGGCVCFALYVGLMFSARKLEKIPRVNLESTIGQVCTTYTRFQPNGQGKVRAKFNGKLSICDAENLTSEQIESFQSVRVVSVKDGILGVVKPTNDGDPKC